MEVDKRHLRNLPKNMNQTQVEQIANKIHRSQSVENDLVRNSISTQSLYTSDLSQAKLDVINNLQQNAQNFRQNDLKIVQRDSKNKPTPITNQEQLLQNKQNLLTPYVDESKNQVQQPQLKLPSKLQQFIGASREQNKRDSQSQPQMKKLLTKTTVAGIQLEETYQTKVHKQNQNKYLPSISQVQNEQLNTINGSVTTGSGQQPDWLHTTNSTLTSEGPIVKGTTHAITVQMINKSEEITQPPKASVKNLNHQQKHELRFTNPRNKEKIDPQEEFNFSSVRKQNSKFSLGEDQLSTDTKVRNVNSSQMSLEYSTQVKQDQKALLSPLQHKNQFNSKYNINQMHRSTMSHSVGGGHEQSVFQKVQTHRKEVKTDRAVKEKLDLINKGLDALEITYTADSQQIDSKQLVSQVSSYAALIKETLTLQSGIEKNELFQFMSRLQQGFSHLNKMIENDYKTNQLKIEQENARLTEKLRVADVKIMKQKMNIDELLNKHKLQPHQWKDILDEIFNDPTALERHIAQTNQRLECINYSNLEDDLTRLDRITQIISQSAANNKLNTSLADKSLIHPDKAKEFGKNIESHQNSNHNFVLQETAKAVCNRVIKRIETVDAGCDASDNAMQAMLEEIDLLGIKMETFKKEVEKINQESLDKDQQILTLTDRVKEWKYMYHDKDLEVQVVQDKLEHSQEKFAKLLQTNDDLSDKLNYAREHVCSPEMHSKLNKYEEMREKLAKLNKLRDIQLKKRFNEEGVQCVIIDFNTKVKQREEAEKEIAKYKRLSMMAQEKIKASQLIIQQQQNNQLEEVKSESSESQDARGNSQNRGDSQTRSDHIIGSGAKELSRNQSVQNTRNSSLKVSKMRSDTKKSKKTTESGGDLDSQALWKAQDISSSQPGHTMDGDSSLNSKQNLKTKKTDTKKHEKTLKHSESSSKSPKKTPVAKQQEQIAPEKSKSPKPQKVKEQLKAQEPQKPTENIKSPGPQKAQEQFKSPELQKVQELKPVEPLKVPEQQKTPQQKQVAKQQTPVTSNKKEEMSRASQDSSVSPNQKFDQPQTLQNSQQSFNKIESVALSIPEVNQQSMVQDKQIPLEADQKDNMTSERFSSDEEEDYNSQMAPASSKIPSEQRKDRRTTIQQTINQNNQISTASMDQRRPSLGQKLIRNTQLLPQVEEHLNTEAQNSDGQDQSPPQEQLERRTVEIVQNQVTKVDQSVEKIEKKSQNKVEQDQNEEEPTEEQLNRYQRTKTKAYRRFENQKQVQYDNPAIVRHESYIQKANKGHKLQAKEASDKISSKVSQQLSSSSQNIQSKNSEIQQKSVHGNIQQSTKKSILKKQTGSSKDSMVSEVDAYGLQKPSVSQDKILFKEVTDDKKRRIDQPIQAYDENLVQIQSPTTQRIDYQEDQQNQNQEQHSDLESQAKLDLEICQLENQIKNAQTIHKQKMDEESNLESSELKTDSECIADQKQQEVQNDQVNTGTDQQNLKKHAKRKTLNDLQQTNEDIEVMMDELQKLKTKREESSKYLQSKFDKFFAYQCYGQRPLTTGEAPSTENQRSMQLQTQNSDRSVQNINNIQNLHLFANPNDLSQDNRNSVINKQDSSGDVQQRNNQTTDGSANDFKTYYNQNPPSSSQNTKQKSGSDCKNQSAGSAQYPETMNRQSKPPTLAKQSGEINSSSYYQPYQQPMHYTPEYNQYKELQTRNQASGITNNGVQTATNQSTLSQGMQNETIKTSIQQNTNSDYANNEMAQHHNESKTPIKSKQTDSAFVENTNSHDFDTLNTNTARNTNESLLMVQKPKYDTKFDVAMQDEEESKALESFRKLHPAFVQNEATVSISKAKKSGLDQNATPHEVLYQKLQQIYCKAYPPIQEHDSVTNQPNLLDLLIVKKMVDKSGDNLEQYVQSMRGKIIESKDTKLMHNKTIQTDIIDVQLIQLQNLKKELNEQKQSVTVGTQFIGRFPKRDQDCQVSEQIIQNSFKAEFEHHSHFSSVNSKSKRNKTTSQPNNLSIDQSNNTLQLSQSQIESLQNVQLPASFYNTVNNIEQQSMSTNTQGFGQDSQNESGTPVRNKIFSRNHQIQSLEGGNGNGNDDDKNKDLNLTQIDENNNPYASADSIQFLQNASPQQIQEEDDKLAEVKQNITVISNNSTKSKFIPEQIRKQVQIDETPKILNK